MNEGAYTWINLQLTAALLWLDSMFEPLRNNSRSEK
jgi:hypothetical protein